MSNPAAPASAAIDDLLATIANNLVARTRQAGMDRLDLARLADLNRNTIGAALAGGDIKLSTLVRITRALGYSDWLLPLLTPPEPSPMEQLRASQKGRRRSRKRLPVMAAAAEAAPSLSKPLSRPLGRSAEVGQDNTGNTEQQPV